MNEEIEIHDDPIGAMILLIETIDEDLRSIAAMIERDENEETIH